jgi:hypothetical protein
LLLSSFKLRPVVSPNPFVETTKVICEGEFEYTVEDLAGNVYDRSSAIGQVILGEQLHSGVYLVKITAADQIYVFKVVKE